MKSKKNKFGYFFIISALIVATIYAGSANACSDEKEPVDIGLEHYISTII